VSDGRPRLGAAAVGFALVVLPLWGPRGSGDGPARPDVHPGVGASFLPELFVIVGLGGLGSMPGAAVGRALVGVIEGIVGLDVQAAVGQIVPFGVFAAILVARPSGRLGVEGR